LFYGAMLATMAAAIVRYVGNAAVGLALLTGFVWRGPLLATGCCALSRDRERGQRPRFARSLLACRENLSSFGFFGAILALLLAVWIRISMMVVALFFDGPPPHAGTLLVDVLAAPNGAWFLLTYAAAGFGIALLVFAISVVSLPLLLDRRQADITTAIMTSDRALSANRGPLLLWAALIAALTAFGFATWYVGLVLVMPLIGHASWHAYRDLVAPIEAAPE